MKEELQGQDTSFTALPVSLRLKEGDSVKLADATLDVFETPGHTKDCLSYFWKEKGILFCGEAAAVYADGHFHSVFLSDYANYINSIHKIIADEMDSLVDRVEQDRMGSVIGIKEGLQIVADDEPRRKIMLAAHLDDLVCAAELVSDLVMQLNIGVVARQQIGKDCLDGEFGNRLVQEKSRDKNNHSKKGDAFFDDDVCKSFHDSLGSPLVGLLYSVTIPLNSSALGIWKNSMA